jgi:hypothetical protein
LTDRSTSVAPAGVPEIGDPSKVLVRPPIPPRYALLLLFLVVDAVLVVGPFYALRYADGPHGTPERAAFLAAAAGAALLFGFVAAARAEGRGRAPWFFLLGHVGLPVAFAAAAAGADRAAPVVLGAWRFVAADVALFCCAATSLCGAALAAFLTRGSPRVPAAPGRATAAICRAAAGFGDLRVGIALMVAIALVIAGGTLVEDRFGAKAAQALVYRAPWFGALFFAGGVSMLCATFRKSPFRLEQAGWLTVHAGLAAAVVGAMTSFLSSVEGELTLAEGETKDSFTLSTQTRLDVDEFAAGPAGSSASGAVLRAVADFDVNPAVTEPERAYALPGLRGGRRLSLVVDRYYASAEPVAAWRDDGPTDRRGVELALTTGAGASRTLRLDERGEREIELPFGERGLTLTLFRAPPALYDALLRKGPAAGRGVVVVTAADGRDVLTVPVEPPADARPDGRPARIDRTYSLPESDVRIRLGDYCDNLRVAAGGKELADASPGNPLNPAVEVAIAGAAGEDRHHALAFFPERPPPGGAFTDGRKLPYRVSYRFEPAVELPGPGLLFAAVGDDLRWVYVAASGERVGGVVAEGAALALPVPGFALRATKLFRRLRATEEYAFKGYRGERQAIRVRIDGASDAPEPAWIPLGRRATLEAGGRTFVVAWSPATRALGFSLQLHDFRRDFYPGSSEESSFESYCRLTHPRTHPAGADVKIDMNRPLRLDGWRLFQARFGGDGRSTTLQVNRDPGLAILYPAFAVVLAGLAAVFFLKEPLRRRRLATERVQESPAPCGGAS